jgi:nucleoside-diphosphate-sugar epimerase
MRVLLVGASGAIGRRLIPWLLHRGYEVIGAFKNPAHFEQVQSLGAKPVVLDVLDREAVRKTVLGTGPDVIIHEATALGVKFDFKHLDRSFVQTNKLRTLGTDNLLAAAKDAGIGRFVAQSYANYRYVRSDGWVKSEDDPLDPNPLPAMKETYDAMSYLDKTVTEAGGVALRYGGFYGDPYNETERAGMLDPVRKRMFPIIGDGSGYFSFIHLEDAAEATALALEHEVKGIYNIVDDEPAPLREWLPFLASVLGAKPPRHFPAWLARLFAGDLAVMMGTRTRAASNAKAKLALRWALHYPSWRQGFVAAYASWAKTGPI